MFRKYKVAYLLIFIFQNCGIIYAQNINLKETKKNTIKKEFKNVLIIGAGSTATRLVLDNLTDNLIKKLNKENINATYNYVGKLDRNTQIDFKNFINENYDGYLVFNLADTSYIDIKNKDFPLSIPIPIGGSIVRADINIAQLRYSEDFLIQFFEYSNIKETLWEAILKLNFDFSKDKFYQKFQIVLLKVLKKTSFCNYKNNLKKK